MTEAAGNIKLRVEGGATSPKRRDLGSVSSTLSEWLNDHHIFDAPVTVEACTLPVGTGVANETLFARLGWEDGRSPSSFEVVVRIETGDALFPVATVDRSARIISALDGIAGVPVPKILAHEQSAEVFGAPFFIMSRIAGRVPTDNPPFHAEGWVAELDEGQRRRMWEDAVDVMARIHAIGLDRVAFLDDPVLGRSGLEQDLHYWLAYHATTAVPSSPVIKAAEAWLRENFPERPPTELAWGDCRVANMIFDDRGNVTAVLDWDMVSLAGGESDLAWWAVMDITNTISAGIERLPGFGTPHETIARWEQSRGRPAHAMEYQLVFAAYRMAVIMVRLSKLLRQGGTLPDANAQHMATANPGIQYLATMLHLSDEFEVATPWPGLDA
ncbi:phosphotransferase family protein [Sphingosinicella soli]|uniref:Aminoglycoside phosphotransferase (APT) family kinase protein n=1 Tax=Sphingosinicella soli TaxID=333708 RepID=A0A7W7F649_9SPHN|nr:phosphotransferase family protein [Sphingosinicella soli]MBB4632001.1 aminoglycoside phosphotransferase (APT) family kinase protein [Sphingosinicella soli]